MSATLDDQLAMKTLLLAQKYGFDDIRITCCEQLASMKVDTLKNLDGFQDLDGNSMKSILLPQLERCQSCLKEVLPQLVGLMEFAVYLLKDNTNPSIKRCSEHYKGHEAAATTASAWRLRNCTVCQEMFKRIHKCGRKEQVSLGGGTMFGTNCPEYKYGYFLHFNEKIVDVSRTVMDILGTPCFAGFPFSSNWASLRLRRNPVPTLTSYRLIWSFVIIQKAIRSASLHSLLFWL